MKIRLDETTPVQKTHCYEFIHKNRGVFTLRQIPTIQFQLSIQNGMFHFPYFYLSFSFQPEFIYLRIYNTKFAGFRIYFFGSSFCSFLLIRRKQIKSNYNCETINNCVFSFEPFPLKKN